MGFLITFNDIESTLERETGIELASLVWKTKVLPLNYSRIGATQQPQNALQINSSLVERAGFEPAYS